MVDDPADAEPGAVADAVFRAVSDTERRYVLYYLRARNSVSVEELATALAGWLGARGPDPAVVTPADHQRVRVRLHHEHLPRLDDEGFVRYDREAGEVELAALPETLDTVLDLSLAHERQASDLPDPTDGDSFRAGE